MNSVPLEPRNWLRRGDKVLMKDGRILTIKSLEYSDFCAKESDRYEKKREIVGIIDDKLPQEASDE